MTSARTFLAECFVPGAHREDIEAAGERARVAAEAMRADGSDVEYLGAMFVAIDEVVFHAFATTDVSTATEAGRRAALPFARIVESVGVPAGVWLPDMERGHAAP